LVSVKMGVVGVNDMMTCLMRGIMTVAEDDNCRINSR